LATPGCQAGGFVRSRPDVEHPDIQFIFMPPVFEDNGQKANTFEVSFNGGVNFMVYNFNVDSGGCLIVYDS
jgi:choline dehydrogenase-like flavoprotein